LLINLDISPVSSTAFKAGTWFSVANLDTRSISSSESSEIEDPDQSFKNLVGPLDETFGLSSAMTIKQYPLQKRELLQKPKSKELIQGFQLWNRI
jgi:hypothetical protein